MSTDGDQSDREAEIRAIVQDELEKQDELVSGTVPISRRDVLKGGTALGIGGVLGAGLTSSGAVGQAEAAASGQVGTSDKRVDVYGNVVDANSASIANDVNAGSVSTDELNNEQHVDPGESVQAAADALPAGTLGESDSGGGKLVLEAGDHDVSAEAPITLPAGATVEAAGEKATKVINTSANDTFVRDNSGGTTNPDRVVIRDLQLVSDGSAGVGIRFNNVHNWYIENVNVHGHSQAFHMTAAWLGTIVDCRTKNNGQTGTFDRGADGDTNAIRINSGSFHDDGPMLFEDGHGIFIQGGSFEHDGVVNIELGGRNRNMNGVTIRDCYFENAGVDAPYIRAGDSATYSNAVQSLLVEGCEFNTNSPHIEADLVTGLTIRDNLVDGGNPSFDFKSNCTDVEIEENTFGSNTQTVANASTDALVNEYDFSQFNGRLQEAFNQINADAVLKIDQPIATDSAGGYTLGTAGVTIRGQGYSTYINGRGGSALIIQANDVTIENVRLYNNNGGGGGDVLDIQGDDCHISNVWITESDGHGLTVGDTYNGGTVTGLTVPAGATIGNSSINIGGNGWAVTGSSIQTGRILLNSVSNNCAVSGCRVSNGVTNNGTGNVTAAIA